MNRLVMGLDRAFVFARFPFRRAYDAHSLQSLPEKAKRAQRTSKEPTPVELRHAIRDCLGPIIAGSSLSASFNRLFVCSA